MSLRVDVERKLGAFSLRASFAADVGVTALFGRSGAGKSSLVNVIAGLIKPDRGRVEVEGRVLFDSERGIDVPTARRRIGYVFQEGRLFPHYSVRQNLLYGRFFNGANERHLQFDQVVELLDLAHLLERRPAALSGGEKQRVAIGRALLASPQVLLMDEPLASLDEHRKGEILKYIERLRDGIRIPIVYVSHAIEEVVRLADTIVLMSEGSVRAVGRPEEIMGRLDLRPMTGRYEGGAVIETRVSAYDDKYGLTTLSFPGGQLLAPNVLASIGEFVRVRVRARDVSLALAPPAGVSIVNVLHGRIAEISVEQGPAAVVRVRVGEISLLARVARRSLDELSLEPGMEIYAMIKAISLDRHSVAFA
ncbi:MAG: molybdenum ABC transporter ATP-binding protein [Pseudomonadota bacterium]